MREGVPDMVLEGVTEGVRVFEFVLDGVVVRVDVLDGEKDPDLERDAVPDPVAVGERVIVRDTVPGAVGVRVGLEPCVDDGVWVRVPEAVREGVPDMVLEGVAEPVGVRLGEAVGVRVCVPDTEPVREGVPVLDGVAVSV